MTTKEPAWYSEITDSLDELSSTGMMLTAFSGMLEHTLRAGEDVNFIADGAGMLLERMGKTIEEKTALLREQYYELKISTVKNRDINAVPAKCGVSSKVVAIIVSAAFCIPLSHFEQHPRRNGEGART